MSDTPQSQLATVEKLSRRLFPMRGVAMAAAILFIIGTAGFLSIEYLKRSTKLMVEDSLTGLADASLVESFNKTLLLVTAKNDTERDQYSREFDDCDRQLSQETSAYAASIFAADDRANFDHMIQCRKSFLMVRSQIATLVQDHKYVEAQASLKTSLLPAYREYKLSAERMMTYNSDKSKMRGNVILEICIATQFLIAVAGIGLFLLGFFLGFFK
jgi:Four helix bundle sensory module for signal transduction